MTISEPVWSVEEACLKKQIYYGSDRAVNHLSVARNAQGRRFNSKIARLATGKTMKSV